MKDIKDLGFGIIQVNELKPTMSKMESVDNYLCKWQKLKEWLDRVFQIYLNESDHKMMSIYGTILDKMRELEAEDVED